MVFKIDCFSFNHTCKTANVNILLYCDFFVYTYFYTLYAPFFKAQ